jgi:hypothetical protein
MAVAKPFPVHPARRFCILLRNHLLALAFFVLLAICGGFDHRHIANERDYLEHPTTEYSNDQNEIDRLAEDLQVHTARQASETQVMLKDDELRKWIDAHRHKRHSKHAALHAGDRGKVADGATTP